MCAGSHHFTQFGSWWAVYGRYSVKKPLLVTSCRNSDIMSHVLWVSANSLTSSALSFLATSILQQTTCIRFWHLKFEIQLHGVTSFGIHLVLLSGRIHLVTGYISVPRYTLVPGYMFVLARHPALPVPGYIFIPGYTLPQDTAWQCFRESHSRHVCTRHQDLLGQMYVRSSRNAPYRPLSSIFTRCTLSLFCGIVIVVSNLHNGA